LRFLLPRLLRRFAPRNDDKKKNPPALSERIVLVAQVGYGVRSEFLNSLSSLKTELKQRVVFGADMRQNAMCTIGALSIERGEWLNTIDTVPVFCYITLSKAIACDG
jgi:hypothetical protein